MVGTGHAAAAVGAADNGLDEVSGLPIGHDFCVTCRIYIYILYRNIYIYIYKK